MVSQVKQVLTLLVVLLAPLVVTLNICVECNCSSPKPNEFTINCAGKELDDESLTALDIPENATTLILDNNPLTEASIKDGLFENLTSLSTLSLKKLKLKQVMNDTFRGLQQLQQLYLSNSALSQVSPRAFEGLQSLTFLDLSSNNFSSMPNLNSLEQIPLKDLILAQNLLLKEVRFDKCCTSLNKLVLSGCAIAKLQNATFTSLTNLKNLDLGSNKLASLDSQVFSALTLASLTLSNNPIGSQLSNLVYQIPPSLESLKLANCNITSLSADGFGKLARLQTLDLSRNPLVKLSSGAFRGLSKLQVLDLSDASIAEIDDSAFSSLSNLRTLNLKSNRLSTLPAALFDSSKTLVYLYLQNNTISHWPVNVFSSLVALKTLDMSSNSIQLIQSDTVNALPNATLVWNLTGNAWACNCSLVWFRNWLSYTQSPSRHGQDEQSRTGSWSGSGSGSGSGNVSVPEWKTFECGKKSEPELVGVKFLNFTEESLDCDGSSSQRTSQSQVTSPAASQQYKTVSTTAFLFSSTVSVTTSETYLKTVEVTLFVGGLFFMAALLFSLFMLCLLRQRYRVAISLHQCCVTENGRADSPAGDNRTFDEQTFCRINAGFEYDVYVLFAACSQDGDWVRNVLCDKLHSLSYRCLGHDEHSSACCYASRLTLMDSCANVLVVLGDSLELARSTVLQLDLLYAYQRASKFPQRFAQPIVVTRAAFCVCGSRQKLPKQLLAHVHCASCHQSSANPASRYDSSAVSQLTVPNRCGLLNWPDASSDSQAEFWLQLKALLGPPLLVSDQGLQMMPST